jgi:hypothetical protein
MSSNVGKFLLGGIRFQRNFIGKQTMTSGLYTLIECTVKVSPFLVLSFAHRRSSALEALNAERAVEGNVTAEVRRSSFE